MQAACKRKVTASSASSNNNAWAKRKLKLLDRYLWHTENSVVRLLQTILCQLVIATNVLFSREQVKIYFKNLVRLVPTIPCKLHMVTNVMFSREQVKIYFKNVIHLKDKKTILLILITGLQLTSFFLCKLFGALLLCYLSITCVITRYE